MQNNNDLANSVSEGNASLEERPAPNAINNTDENVASVGESATFFAVEKQQNVTEAEENAEIVANTAQKENSEQSETATSGPQKSATEQPKTGKEQSAESAKQDKATTEQPTEQEKEKQPQEKEEGATVEPAFLVDNVDDSELLADEVGVSDEFDEYGREILEPVFENILRLSPNSIKLIYSKLKNTILAYKDVKQRYVDDEEVFKKGNKLLARIELDNGGVTVFFALDGTKLSKEEYPFTIAKAKKYATTPVKVSIKKDVGKKSGTALQKSLDLIKELMEVNAVPKMARYTPTAYAERYPFNPSAVLRGKESEPFNEEFDSDEYDYISGELTRNIIDELMGVDFKVEEKKGKKKLEALRQQATTIKSAVALTEPIVYFYDGAMSTDNTLAFINVQQVLNDKFMGKVIPQTYFAVAELSTRIEQLNFLALKEVVENCDANPKLNFALKISCRMLAKREIMKRMLKAVKTENANLILAFDCQGLNYLGEYGLSSLKELRDNDVKLMLDGMENVKMRFLTECDVEFMRFDSRYYNEENLRSVAQLEMLTGYAKVQNVVPVADGVENLKVAKFLLQHGITAIQGACVAQPKRLIAAAVKEAKKLPPVGG